MLQTEFETIRQTSSEEKRLSFRGRLLKIENRYWSEGFKRIAGVDEAGRGPLAGPVVASAVILAPENIPHGLNDSKQITPALRERFFAKILDTAEVGVGLVGEETIDKINIRSLLMPCTIDGDGRRMEFLHLKK